MTLSHQDQLSQVRQKITEANPDILKPHRGARIRRNRDGKEGFIVTDFFNVDFCTCCYVLYDNEAGYTHMAQYAEFTLPEGHQHYDLKLDVIGRPIHLADVLLALQESKRHAQDVIGIVARSYWNLRQDDIDQQSPDTISFLHHLLVS